MYQDIFVNLFERAQIARFNSEKKLAHEDSLEYYRELKNIIDTASDEGREECWETGALDKSLEIAGNLLDVLDDATIAHKTGLTTEQVAEFR